MHDKRQPLTALVLGGGGARGAYEAGVLHYLRTEVARDLGFQPGIDIVCGTSVGAINACHVAIWADEPVSQASTLNNFWAQLQINEIFQIPASHLLQLPRWFTGKKEGRMSIVCSQALEKLVTHNGQWSRIKHNINKGAIKGLTVTATRVDDGRVTVFFEAHQEIRPRFAPDPNRVAHRVRMGPRHALASAAIPFLFPAVPINGRLYYDGGLQQNTPLRPALALGARRVLVVCIDKAWAPATPEVDQRPVPRKQVQPMRYPSAPEIFANMLDALLMDHVERDLEHIRQINKLLGQAQDLYGDEFVAKLSSLQDSVMQAPLRHIDEILLEPGENIADIASRHLPDAIAKAGALAGRLLGSMNAAPGGTQGHLPSYYLFHGPYARDLMELARADCKKIHTELCAFFDIRK